MRIYSAMKIWSNTVLLETLALSLLPLLLGTYITKLPMFGCDTTYSNKSIFCRTKFRVVNPLSIELPRSIGMVVINWNVPMHLFLKECKLIKK